MSPALKALLLHAAVALLVPLCAFAVSTWGIFPTGCIFYELVGKPCLGCGGTRAAYALLDLRIARSALLNPAPLLFAVCAVSLVGVELVRVLMGKREALPKNTVPFMVLTSSAIIFVFGLLRWFGVLPLPENVGLFLAS